MITKCRRPTCRKRFSYEPLVLDGTEVPCLFCPACREGMLGRQEYAQNKQALIERNTYASSRLDWDYRIIDENGDEVWALDLAARYHQQTRPTPL